jgi:rhamnosyltransferase
VTPPASVIVRCKDEEQLIERALRSLRAQTVEPEIVVVDSGSRDRSLPIARRYADQLIEIPPERFSYGRALNLGAAAGSAPFHFALSAHCWAERTDWIELSLAHYERPDVAATGGMEHDPDLRPLAGPLLQDEALGQAHPFWGFSNHASSWRAEVWREFPFDERLVTAEDREWASRVLAAGYLIAYDPALFVDLSHRWRLGTRNYYRRNKVEARIVGTVYRADCGLVDIVHEWWSIPDQRHSALFHRLNPRRMAGLVGKWQGLRAAARGGSREIRRGSP